MTEEDRALRAQPLAHDTLVRDVPAWDLERRCHAAVDAGARVQFAYGWFPQSVEAPVAADETEASRAEVPELRYVVHAAAGHAPEIWRCRPGALRPPSLAAIAPLVSWYEREITDLCGLAFEDQPQPEPLVLLPGTHAARAPLRPGIAPPLAYTPEPCRLPELAGSAHRDVQVLPFGEQKLAF